MKHFTNRILLTVAGAGAALALSASTASATIHSMGAIMDGAHENPTNASPATGSAFFTMDDITGQIANVSGSFSGLTGDLLFGHIHGLAGPGTNAPVIITFTFSPAPGPGVHAGTITGITGTSTLTAPQITGMLGGLTYVNIHSSPNFGGGEIRGQVFEVPEPTFLGFAGLSAGCLALRAWSRKFRKAA